MYIYKFDITTFFRNTIVNSKQIRATKSQYTRITLKLTMKPCVFYSNANVNSKQSFQRNSLILILGFLRTRVIYLIQYQICPCNINVITTGTQCVYSFKYCKLFIPDFKFRVFCKPSSKFIRLQRKMLNPMYFLILSLINYYYFQYNTYQYV